MSPSLKTIGVFSKGILRIPFIGVMLGAAVRGMGGPGRAGIDAIAGWGCRPTAARARHYAARAGLPFLALEDGFLRSYGTGASCPSLSLVLDQVGIYYDSTRPSTLETLLNAPSDLLAGLAPQIARARELIVRHRLSKYNHAPLADPAALGSDGRRRVLVVDQTIGDMSVALGAASAASFVAMLAAARADHPDAVVYVKTHPEVSAGTKRGYLTGVVADGGTVVLAGLLNPLSLIEHMDHVYVVTSAIGFEALLAGKPVTVFGKPWYAGWGLTDDRQPFARRSRRRSVDELFCAAYFHYSRYLDPQRHLAGSIFDVIEWLARQRQMADRFPERMICVGFRRWKAANLAPLLSLERKKVIFVPNTAAAVALEPVGGDCLVYWGCAAPAGLSELAQASGTRLVRVRMAL
jgi:capsular polysaccharide export protein